MRKRPIKVLLLLTLVVAIIRLAFWSSSKQGPSRQVTRLASLQDWQLGYGYVFSNEPYLWLTNHELLHFDGDSMRGIRAFSSDILTHAEVPEPGITAMQQGHVISASPDGQWVLWNTQQFNTSVPGMAASQPSGGKTVRWPHLQTWGSTGFWLPDSRRWVCVNFVPTGQMINHQPVAEKRLVVYDVSRPGIRTFPIPGDTGAENILGVTPQGKIIFNDTFDGWGGPPGQPQPPLSLREVSLDGPQPTARTFQVQVPKTPPGESPRLLLSPRGDRLLWTCFSARQNLFLVWLSSLTHRSFGGSGESLDIWTCPLDGSAPSHVGTWSSPQMGFTACWNPDGKHVSMTMQNQLYSISVP